MKDFINITKIMILLILKAIFLQALNTIKS